MRRQVALADTGAPGLFQDLMDFLDGKELGYHAEANESVIRLPAGNSARVRAMSVS